LRKKTKLFAILCIGLLAAALTGCSTSKNTFPNRAYHNVTCKYNVYWNGNQAMKDAEKELAKLSKDNYTATLPIYNYPDKSELGPCLSHLDRTIEKSSKAIHKHSMMFKGKEYVKTIDDAYFLMAKSYFYKQDYVQAQRVLNYIVHTYPKSNILDEAEVLLARTQMRQGYFASADELLETIRYMNEKKNKKNFAVLFNAAKAEYHLTAPDGDVQEAIDYIGNALSNHPKRDFRTRLQLILGELYETLGQQAEAQKNFKEVIKKSNNYEMTFCAQMHLAANYDGTESNRNTITKQLNKMLNDKKNEDYRDQIYYAFSEIARIDEDDELRKEYLAKSVAASTDNNYQKTFSSITLADLYFDDNEYREAQNYYDTAMMVIPKNYPNYEELQKKSNVLKDLVDKLNEIDLQDSLLRIANLPEGQRNAWVRKMIADYTEAERKAAAEEAERMLAMQNAASYTNINVNQNSSNGKWYFYNQSLVTAGQQDFFRRFGNRKLEDNWFISNKTQISFDDMALMNDPSLAQDTVEYDEDGNPIPKRETDPKKEAYYLQDLPLTQGAKDTANAIIARDLYETGFMYQDLLNDTKRACASFESLLQRYPKSEYALPSIFMLYTLYKKIGDPKAETYKNTLLTQYPETDYAKLIQDPDYYNKLAAKEKTLENQYAEVYQDFVNKRWSSVVSAANAAIPNCTDETLQSQYAYLRAIAAGQVYNEDTLIVGLTNVVKNYPQQPVAELARLYLTNFTEHQIRKALGIEENSPEQAEIQQAIQPEVQKSSAFVFNPTEQHYIILLVKTADLPLQTVKQNVTNFNNSNFSLKKLTVSSFFIDNQRQMITISKFQNNSDAMDYYNLLLKDELFKSDIERKTIEPFAISSTNYTTFYNKRNERDNYNDFFKENYLKQQ
jgi:TolA-binding protein